MKTDLKRQNFNITPEQEAEILWLKDALNSPTTKDAILAAVHTFSTLAHEVRGGRSIYLLDKSGERERLFIPELERVAKDEWMYLVERPHPWRRQRYVKGRRTLASSLWRDMQANSMTPEEAAEDWDLPVAAVDEVIRYCEQYQELIAMEAEEELRLLELSS